VEEPGSSHFPTEVARDLAPSTRDRQILSRRMEISLAARPVARSRSAKSEPETNHDRRPVTFRGRVQERGVKGSVGEMMRQRGKKR
jgi:hypothetical protein